MSDKPEVTIGQVYRDKDKRMSDRHLLVEIVDDTKAHCVSCRSDGRVVRTQERYIKIGIKNLQTRFELISK